MMVSDIKDGIDEFTGSPCNPTKQFVVFKLHLQKIYHLFYLFTRNQIYILSHIFPFEM